ncbi:MAG: hypothetical protein N2235_05990 [Fischerella sp.]|nr:hypothetical protein [Fischerella sp.]
MLETPKFIYGVLFSIDAFVLLPSHGSECGVVLECAIARMGTLVFLRQDTCCIRAGYKSIRMLSVRLIWTTQTGDILVEVKGDRQLMERA